MKKILVLLILFLIPNLIYLQNFCSTPTISNNQLINEPFPLENSQSSINLNPHIFNIVFHFVIKSGSEDEISVQTINSMVTKLNSKFNGSGISFNWNECLIDYIIDGPINEEIFTINNFNDAIDIYLFGPSYKLPFNGLANGIGENTELFIQGQSAIDGSQAYFFEDVLSHEMGHIFGLFHTFHEAETSAACCELVNQTQACINGTNSSNENGNTTGDYICDTPAHGIIGSFYTNFDENCDWVGQPSLDPIGVQHQPDGRNLMSYSSCQEYFTDGQSVRMNRAINYLPQLISINNSNTIFINNALTLEGNYIFNSDINIGPNGSLTVNGTIYMGADKKINLFGTLNLNEGTITSVCNEKWSGIEIKSFPINIGEFQFTVYGILTGENNSIISNAKCAIKKEANNSPSIFLDYGYVNFINSSFTNCNQIFQFKQSGNPEFDDNASFTNCTFLDCQKGGVLKNYNGVEFHGCTFLNIDGTGIYAEDSPVIIKGSTFEDMSRALDLSYSSALTHGSEIIGNTFLGIPNEIVKVKNHSGVDDLFFENNNLYGGYFGLFTSGNSYLTNSDNTFVEQNTSTLYHGTGNSELNIDELNSTNISAYAVLVNKTNNVEFLSNCYSGNSYSDWNISGNGASIASSQGSSGGAAANNCFSKSGTPDIYTFGPTIPFAYHYLQNETILCKIPTNSGNYTSNGDAPINPNSGQCGSETNPIPTAIGPRKCPMPSTLAEWQAAYNNMLNLVNLYSQTAATNAYHRYLYYKYYNCLLKLKKWKLKLLRESNDHNWRETAISYFDAQLEFPIKIYAYSLMLEADEFNRAKGWVSNLVKNTEEKIDFATIQNIHLDYLADPDNYTLSGANKTLLETLANKNIALNGFARSVYQKITGDEFLISIDYGNGNIENRSRSKNEISLNIYPNPVSSENLRVSIINNEFNLYDLDIINSSGKIIQSFKNKSEDLLEIKSNEFNSGFYFLRYKNRNGDLLITKFIKI